MLKFPYKWTETEEVYNIVTSNYCSRRYTQTVISTLGVTTFTEYLASRGGGGRSKRSEAERFGLPSLLRLVGSIGDRVSITGGTPREEVGIDPLLFLRSGLDVFVGEGRYIQTHRHPKT